MTESNGDAGASATAAAMLSPGSPGLSPRVSLDSNQPAADDLSARLERALAEKESYSNQYRTLLGKLTAMRNTLGEKLKEDAEELDKRESTINQLNEDNAALQDTVESLRAELESASSEAAGLSSQLAALRTQSDSSSSDVLSLTREMRELRGEMERLRAEREEWEAEAAKERERREAMEDEVRVAERREMEARSAREIAEDERDRETERAGNLQEVLSEFQQAKDSELRQATTELESQLKLAVSQLSEYKLRCANAESSLGSMANDASKSSTLEKAVKEKNAVIAKLRHDAVVTNEHLTEALRRLRKNASSDNVDRRLVTNILLSFLTTSRADTKRFEMLSLLSTILGWDDSEREKAGLQRAASTPKPSRRKSSVQGERSAEEEAAMNESFSNLFVEFLLKEASQGQGDSPAPSTSPLPPRQSPGFSPTSSGATTPSRQRTMSSSSSASGGASLDALVALGRGPPRRNSSFRGSPHQ